MAVVVTPVMVEDTTAEVVELETVIGTAADVVEDAASVEVMVTVETP